MTAKKEEYWWDLIGTATDPELVGFMLHERGAAGLDWTSPDELHCYFYGTSSEQQRFLATARALGFNPIHTERLPLTDWKVSALNDWQSIRVEELVISPLIEPEREEPLKSSNPFELFIHPASGFGTGHHVTTRATLELLLTLKSKKIETVLDAGTGSGVLAMAACRLFGASAKGIDRDETALSYARRNIFFNGFEGRISLSTEPIESLPPAFDLILSNVYTEYHELNEREYHRLLRPGGFIVMSGIAHETRNEFEKKFKARWNIGKSLEYGRWVTMLMQKKG